MILWDITTAGGSALKDCSLRKDQSHCSSFHWDESLPGRGGGTKGAWVSRQPQVGAAKSRVFSEHCFPGVYSTFLPLSQDKNVVSVKL